MTVRIPSQRHRCSRHAWCVLHGSNHLVHHGEARFLTLSSGTELRITLTADAESAPSVVLEATFEHGGAMMEVAEIEVDEAVDLADLLLRLARTTEVSKDGVV